jgi:hypothetical protein
MPKKSNSSSLLVWTEILSAPSSFLTRKFEVLVEKLEVILL